MTQACPALRIAVPEAVDLAAFRSFDPSAPVVHLAGETMGTRWHVRAAVPQSAGLDVQQLQALVQARLDAIVADMSHWEPGSLLSRFNHADGGAQVALSEDFAAVMAVALDIASASGGAFDPALGRITDLWGLGPRQMTIDPGQRQIDETLSHVGWQRLAFDERSRTLRQPGGVWLDLSGIAKGFAADAVADTLAGQGVYHALVEIGGECTGRGLRPDGDPWWVDIENPTGVQLPPLRVALHQLSVATSGDYLRGGHTIDPRTGWPAMHQSTAVTVLHSRCMIADAWATALSVLDDASAQQMARKQRLIARIVARDGSEWLSPGLAEMVGADAAAA
ncbi:FAD:protein FMN transferase [Blastomonas sp. AAP53]|uniref:FAD:protein FMN transferase n=1 Tax=Blastomonas sp. AAP53 TaxID=1248760 RepID=UPI0002EF4A38|nr:FAD:protein FMN transferase [Blastomonas sp. AAP53]